MYSWDVSPFVRGLYSGKARAFGIFLHDVRVRVFLGRSTLYSCLGCHTLSLIVSSDGYKFYWLATTSFLLSNFG